MAEMINKDRRRHEWSLVEGALLAALLYFLADFSKIIIVLMSLYCLDQFD